MAKRIWTTEQTAAFTTRDRTLLISAAAGSGKTATLTERIIRSILDEDNPADIGSMLIVTFTNLAVGELRDRISAAIRDAARANPTDARLEEQLLRVKDAKICTINSFCNDILRAGAEAIGLTPAYRIAEPAEAAIIASGILCGMINSAYEGRLPEVGSAEEFAALAEGLTNVKREGEIPEILTYLYDKLTSEAAGVSMLEELVEMYNSERVDKIENTAPFAFILKKFRMGLSDRLEVIKKYRRELEAAADSPKTANVLSSDIERGMGLLACESYDELYSGLLEFTPKTMASSKNPEYPKIKKKRDELIAYIRKYRDEFFCLSKDNLRELYSSLYKNAKILAKLLLTFDRVFLDEKKRRGIVEFRDAERYACEALYDSHGALTPLATELSQKYSYIYIDEYQDVNALQGKIFDAISREDNCFMVGDIKQSIYGFRAAKPDFFAEKKNSYPKIGEEGDFPKASIFMSENFRCDRPIIDFTNEIFDAMFGLLGGSIGYVSEDRLVFSKKYDSERGETPCGHIPEIHLIERAAAKRPEEFSSPDEFADSVESEEISAAELGAAAVAEQIATLVGKEKKANGEYIRPGDIAILMRSVKNSEAIYADAIRALGLECKIQGGGDFFFSEEVLLVIALLNAIDNPMRDVYLTAVMASPLFGFSFDEILAIRKSAPCGHLYESLRAYCRSNPDYVRGRSALTTLARYRRLSEGMPTDELISLIYRESGLLALASESGRRENLILLHGYARSYEESSFRGLYSFISYLNNIIERGGSIDLSGDGENEDDDSVKIITSHRSKGLEFPVCIIAEASRAIRIPERGIGALVKLSPEMGLGFGVRDERGLALLKNIPAKIISEYLYSREYEEALRLLYVSLTRAKERLYIFGTVNDIEAFRETAELCRDGFSVSTAEGFRSFLDIILACSKTRNIVEHRKSTEKPGSADKEYAQSDLHTLHPSPEHVTETIREAEISSEDIHRMSDELLRRFNYKYPAHAGLTVPGKLSVSALTPAVLDGSERDEIMLSLDDVIDSREASRHAVLGIDALCKNDVLNENNEPLRDFKPTLPAFISGSEADESARRGIATHTFLQFCSFSALRERGAEAELQRLIDEEFISKKNAERVRLPEINKFIKSQLFSEILSAKRLYRELRFNVKLPAEHFTKNPERREFLSGQHILVQGVIDCIIEDEAGNLHLIDYKTDRLTRAERENPSEAGARLIEKHALQLSYYKMAIAKMFGKEPNRVGIYSLHLGEEILL